jgi:hypothetical protein
MSEPDWLALEVIIAIHDEQLAVLGINGVDFIVPEADAAAMIFALGAGEVSEEASRAGSGTSWPKG